MTRIFLHAALFLSGALFGAAVMDTREAEARVCGVTPEVARLAELMQTMKLPVLEQEAKP